MGSQPTRLVTVATCEKEVVVPDQPAEQLLSSVHKLSDDLNLWAVSAHCDGGLREKDISKIVAKYLIGGATKPPMHNYSKVKESNTSTCLDLTELTSTIFFATNVSFPATFWPIGFVQGKNASVARVKISAIGMSFNADGSISRRPTFLSVVHEDPGEGLRLKDAIALALSVFFLRKAAALAPIAQITRDFLNGQEQLLVAYVDPTTTKTICYRINDVMQWIDYPHSRSRGITAFIRQCTISSTDPCAMGAQTPQEAPDIRSQLDQLS